MTSPPPLASRAERTRRGLAVLAVTYVFVAAVVIALAPRSPKAWRLLPDWAALPVQLMAIAAAWSVVWGRWRTRGHTLTIWALVLAFCVMSLIASYVWNVWRTLGKVPSLSFPDFCYLGDYALLTAAYAVAFIRFGGSFREPRTWLDVLTIVVALCGTFWGTLLSTLPPIAPWPRVDLPYAITYAVSLAAWMAMATLLFLRMPKLRPIPTLLIGAGVIDALWEVGWLSTWLTNHNYVERYYNFGDVLCFTLITCAAAITTQRPNPQVRVDSVERPSYAFVPTLSALLAIALVGTSLRGTQAPAAWILVGLVILTALLLVTRHRAARRKMEELHRELAFRAADARVIELVRQSADALLVIDASGIVAFASPAILATAGIAPAQAVGASAASLFGAAHRAAVEQFLRRLKSDPVSPASLELSMEASEASPRILKLHGANRLRNIHIDGLTLTISDISEQRALERDVLTVANHERLRLAGDIHEGLGQELSGIALMLQGLAKSQNLDSARGQSELHAIAGQVAHAIRGARDLARGLSPIYVVRGSLHDALRRLKRDLGNKYPVHVQVDHRFDELTIDELSADQLYRIAREAVQISATHGSCSRIDVRLQALDQNLVLEVADDGAGYRDRLDPDHGSGLRIMEYRARVIGGTFEIVKRPEGGTAVRVRLRRGNIVRNPATA